MKLSIQAGKTSQSLNLFILDSTKSDGSGLTGLVYNSAGLVAYYTHTGTNATATAITLATLASVNSAFSSGGFKEISAANMPGVYRFDIPNNAIAAAKGQSVLIQLQGAANMVPVLIEIELVGWDNQATAISSNMIQIDGSATSGNNATLKLKSLDIQSDSYSVNAVNIVGGYNASGRGGPGIRVVGGDGTSHGYGVHISPSTNGSGSGPAVFLDGSVGGCYGLQITGKSVPSILLQRLDSGSIVIDTIGNGSVIGIIHANMDGEIGSISTVRPKKNTGLSNFMFPMFDATTKNPKTGLTVTAERAIDGNPFSPCSNAAVELSNGVYRVSLSAGDLNGDKIMLRSSATDADDQLIEIITQD